MCDYTLYTALRRGSLLFLVSRWLLPGRGGAIQVRQVPGEPDHVCGGIVETFGVRVQGGILPHRGARVWRVEPSRRGVVVGGVYMDGGGGAGWIE